MNKFTMFGYCLMFMVMILSAYEADAWGKEGHYLVCKIAQAHLSKESSDIVQQLLPSEAEGDLASYCSWPDEVRRFHNYIWSGPLHFIDTEDFRCNFDYQRDCHNEEGEKDMCLSGAISNYTNQLTAYAKQSSYNEYNLTEALLFLSHFMGDIHQPLHVGFTGDKGGNTILIHWYRQKSNLHHAWDTLIIESAMKDFYDSEESNFLQALQENVTGTWSDEVSGWEKCTGDQLACPNTYAAESINLACKWAYKNATPGTYLEDDYFLSRLPIVEKQLAKGGIRLAATLDRIFSSKATS